MHFMVINKKNHQDNGTDNLRNLTSNPRPLLPKPTLLFKLSRGNLIIMPQIMVMLKSPLQSFQLSLTLNQLQIQTPLRLNELMKIKLIISWNYFIQNTIKILYMVAPTSIFYTVFTVFFHKDGLANVSVTNCMSHFSIFVPTNAILKLANGNAGHAQGIGIILCLFPNCSVIYPVGPVYYCPDHPSNTVSSGALNFYIGF